MRKSLYLLQIELCLFWPLFLNFIYISFWLIFPLFRYNLSLSYTIDRSICTFAISCFVFIWNWHLFIYTTRFIFFIQSKANFSAALTTAVVMVTTTVPTVNTLRLYPILKGTGGGVHIFDNASNSTLDEASIIAYEIKQ